MGGRRQARKDKGFISPGKKIIYGRKIFFSGRKEFIYGRKISFSGRKECFLR
jgi:hypothetical protein